MSSLVLALGTAGFGMTFFHLPWPKTKSLILVLSFPFVVDCFVLNLVDAVDVDDVQIRCSFCAVTNSWWRNFG